MTRKTRMLLYSDGSDVGARALRMGEQIAQAMASAVDILAIARTRAQKEAAFEETETTADRLRASDIAVTIYHRPGYTGQELLEQADAIDYDLVVIGSRGRRGIRRLMAGSRACRILGGVATSVLVVKGHERKEINDILVCSAAGPTSRETVQYASQLARTLEASVTLLHVMSQIALQEDAKEADLEAEAEELMHKQAREGIHLANMLKILEDEDVDAQALVRHGLVVDEIIKEARSGRFDMLVIGAHTTRDLSGFLSSNLSRRIMLTANRPILIVHQE